MDAGAIERELDDLETRIERLRALYEQYFMGIEKLEPQIPRKEVERRIQLLRREQIRNTALRFKFQMLVQRYNTMQQYWARVTREIENGTYRRDVMRAAARFGAKEALTILGKRRAQKYAALAEAQAAQKGRRLGGEGEEAEEIDVEPDDDEGEFIADDLVEEAAPSVAVPIPMGEAFGDPLFFLPPAAKEVQPPPAAKEVQPPPPVAPTQAATPTPAGLGGLRWGPPRPAEKSATAAPPVAPAADPRGAIRPAPVPVAKSAFAPGARGSADAVAKDAAAPVAKGPTAPVAKGAVESGVKSAAVPDVKSAAVPDVKSAAVPGVKSVVAPAAKGAVESVAKGAAAPAAKGPAAPVAKGAAEPSVAKSPAEPVAKSAVTPAAKAPAAPVAKGAVEPSVVKRAAEPVAKSAAEPVAKIAAESGVKSAVAPVAKAPAEPVAKVAAESGVKSRVAALAAAARTPAGQRGPTAGGDTAKGIGALDLDLDEGPMRPARKVAAAPSALDLDDLDLGAIGAPNKK